MPEKKIITLIQARNEQGIKELLKHYGPLMRYIIAPILPNIQDQEECVSETAMCVWDKIHLFEPGRGSWNAWLTALTRNAALNRARRNKRFETAEDISPETPLPDPMAEDTVLQQKRQAAVRRALKMLSLEERSLFYRKYYYLQSTAQIASELGTTERAMEGRLSRLKKRLREMVRGELHE